MPPDRWSEFVVATLLVTSFTFFGWVTLWAAHVRANWFVRTVIGLSLLVPLLIARADEVFATFALQGLLIVIAIQLGRWHVRRRRLKAAQPANSATTLPPPVSFHFSMLSMLEVTFLVAAGSWIALRLPKLNSFAWINLAHIAGAAALATMAGTLMGLSRKPVIWLISIGFCLLVGAGRAWSDWFLPSLSIAFTPWPPDPANVIAPVGFGVPNRPIIAWFFIPLSIALLTALFVSLQTRAFPPLQHSTGDVSTPAVPSRSRRRARLGLAALTLLVLAFPLYVLGRLLTPEPIPSATIPNPTGHDDLITAGKVAATTAFEGSTGFDYETASSQALAAEVGKCGDVYESVARGIARACRAPVDYSSSAGLLPMDDIIRARATARALGAKARLDEMNGRFDDAAAANVQGIQFGNSFRQGGLLVDAFVGIACAAHGTEQLYKQRNKLSPHQLDDCIAKLIRLDSDDEPYDDVRQRDHVWAQRAYGWHGHLQQMQNEFAGTDSIDGLFSGTRGYEYAYWAAQARLRLLICELALTRYQQDNKHWPRSLDELAPKYLARVPVDPLSPTGGTLKYRPTDKGYILYSLGPNCIDDNGATPAPGDEPPTPESGDLRLDCVFGTHLWVFSTNPDETARAPNGETSAAP